GDVVARSKTQIMADINIADAQGRTAMHIAAWAGSMDTFQRLRDLDGDLGVEDKQGRTVFHYAATARDPEVFDWLVDHEDESVKLLNRADDHGWMPLHWACR
ncbi:ankyrin, partial [Canariomyces notabilis]